MSDKLSKALVLYVFNPTASYTCSECCYGAGGKCSQYTKADEDIKPFGSCNLWDWDEDGTKKLSGSHSRTKETTGYMENEKGFGCRRCEEWVQDTKRCKKVDEAGPLTPGRIDGRACCSRWEKDPLRGSLSDAEFRLK